MGIFWRKRVLIKMRRQDTFVSWYQNICFFVTLLHKGCLSYIATFCEKRYSFFFFFARKCKNVNAIINDKISVKRYASVRLFVYPKNNFWTVCPMYVSGFKEHVPHDPIAFGTFASVLHGIIFAPIETKKTPTEKSVEYNVRLKIPSAITKYLRIIFI